MIQTNYSTRVYIDNRVPYVMIRVQWMKKTRQVYFSVGCKADTAKWDATTQRAHLNTTHKVGEETFSARFINSKIEHKLEMIKVSFTQFDLKSEIPTVEQIRAAVEEVEEENSPKKAKVNKTLTELFEDYLNVCSDERNWSAAVHYKYQQVWNQLNASDPNISLETLTKERMVNLKNWYVENGYRNVTITKQIKMLKTFLRWVKAEGYDIAPGVIEYKVNLKVIPKTVTFLKYQELIHFMDFKFPPEKNYLARARDMFCFMSFTSLRYSDLKALRRSSVYTDHIDVCTQKTSDSLHIPLVEQAKLIMARYWGTADTRGGFLFPVPSNQKLNQYLKEAAKLAGLDREIVQTYFTGSKRNDVPYKFCDQISCHDARRTFVCVSLALGIPANIVMSCTGHKDFESMKPYIEVADETQKKQMSKWNAQGLKTDIINRLDGLNTEQLIKVLQAVVS